MWVINVNACVCVPVCCTCGWLCAYAPCLLLLNYSSSCNSWMGRWKLKLLRNMIQPLDFSIIFMFLHMIMLKSHSRRHLSKLPPKSFKKKSEQRMMSNSSFVQLNITLCIITGGEIDEACYVVHNIVVLRVVICLGSSRTCGLLYYNTAHAPLMANEAWAVKGRCSHLV